MFCSYEAEFQLIKVKYTKNINIVVNKLVLFTYVLLYAVYAG